MLILFNHIILLIYCLTAHESDNYTPINETQADNLFLERAGSCFTGNKLNVLYCVVSKKLLITVYILINRFLLYISLITDSRADK